MTTVFQPTTQSTQAEPSTFKPSTIGSTFHVSYHITAHKSSFSTLLTKNISFTEKWITRFSFQNNTVTPALSYKDLSENKYLAVIAV